MTLITTSKLHSEAMIQQFLQASGGNFPLPKQLILPGLQLRQCNLQVVYFAVQSLVGPSKLEMIAAVNTANDDVRRGLSGQLTLFTNISFVLTNSWLLSLNGVALCFLPGPTSAHLLG